MGGATVPFDLLAEFLPAKERGSFLIFIEYFWTIGSIFVIMMAWWLLRVYDWRILAMVTSVPVGISCILSVWYLPESARWLLIENRREEAEAVVRNAGLVNGVDLGEFKLTISEQEIEEAREAAQIPWYSVYAPLFDHGIIKVTIPLATVWCSFAFLYYGIILFVTRIYSTSDDDASATVCHFNYVPILEDTLSEFVGVTVVIMTINSLGRVKTQWIGYLLGGIGVLVMGLTTNNNTSLLLFGFLGRSAAMGASCATWVCTPEVFPTSLRASGHSFCNMAAKMAAFAVPYVIFSSLSDASLGVVLAAFNFIAAAAAYMLPETANKSLDDAIRISRDAMDPVDKVHSLLQDAIRSVSGETGGRTGTGTGSTERESLSHNVRNSSL